MAEGTGSAGTGEPLLVVVPLPADAADRALVLRTGLLPDGASLLERARATGEGLLAACAGRVEVVDPSSSDPDVLGEVRRSAPPGTWVVVVEPLCGLVTGPDVARVLSRARASGGCAAAVLPVTDTLKAVHEDSGRLVVDATVDRDGCVAAATPLVVPPAVALAAPVPLGDPAAALAALRRAAPVRLVDVGGSARRVHSPADLEVLLAGAAAAAVAGQAG